MRATRAQARGVDAGLEALQRRTMRVLVAAQIFGGGGFFLGFAVSVLLARELTDSDSLVGIPVAFAVAAAALAAGPLGSWMQRSGRRPGLAAGQLCGATGAVGVVLAARADSLALFCVAMALFGAGNAANPLAQRARAQGRADLAMGMAGAAGSLAAGPVMHAGNFAALALLGAFLGSGLVLIAIRAGLFSAATAEAA